MAACPYTHSGIADSHTGAADSHTDAITPLSATHAYYRPLSQRVGVGGRNADPYRRYPASISRICRKGQRTKSGTHSAPQVPLDQFSCPRMELGSMAVLREFLLVIFRLVVRVKRWGLSNKKRQEVGHDWQAHSDHFSGAVGRGGL